MPTPTLVQHVASASTRASTSGRFFHVQLPNPTLSGNCLLVAFQYALTTVTSVVTKDAAGTTLDTLTLLKGGTNSQIFNVYGIFNCTAGAVRVDVTLAAISDDCTFCATEFTNVATSSAVDGTSTYASMAGPSAYQSGAVTTVADGDLIVQWAWQDGVRGWYGTSFAPNAGFTLLHADIGDGHAAQFGIQATHGAINPTLTMVPGTGGGSITVALKAATAGTAPAAGIRVLRHQDYTVTGSASSYTCQFPASGNLLVAIHDGYNGSPNVHCRVTSIADTVGNTWRSRATASQNTSGTPGNAFFDHQILDAVNATGSNANTLTVTLDNPSGGSTLCLFDVTGAATDPFDVAAIAIGNQVAGTGAIPTVTITPFTAAGLILMMINQDIGTQRSVTTNTGTTCADQPWYDEESGGFNQLAEDKGVAHTYNADTTAITYTWTADVSSVGGVGAWAAVAAAYKTAGPSPTLEQEGYRWRDDDGSEATATALAAQDAAITRPAAANTRLRLAVNATNDPASANYQLESRLSTDATYLRVNPQLAAVTATPVVQGRANAQQASNSNTHAITLPAGVAVGELLLCVFSAGSNPTCTTTSNNWQNLGQAAQSTAVAGCVFAKFADGNDALTVVTSTQQQSTHVTLRISGGGMPIGASANASSTNSDPPAFDAGLASNYLWIATRSGLTSGVATVAPTSYSNLTSQAATNATGASTSTAERANAVQAENPATFTSVTHPWVSWTLAIPPRDGIPRFASAGAVATGTTTVAVPYPENIIAGDLLVIAASSRNAAGTALGGWTEVTANATLGAAGADAGQVFGSVYYKESDGTELPAASLTVAVAAGTGSIARMFCYRRDPLRKWAIASTSGTDTTAGTAWSVTGGANPGITPNDIVVCTSATNTDLATYSAQALTATGATIGVNLERQDSVSATGNDEALVVSEHRCTAGTATAAPAYAMTASASGTSAPAGPTIFLRLRASDPDICLAASASIAAGGATATTAQLAAPAGKASGADFQAGTIADDTNPLPALDLGSDKYTELEWCLLATAAVANGNVYQFQVTRAGSGLDIYTVTPQWTIGATPPPAALAPRPLVVGQAVKRAAYY